MEKVITLSNVQSKESNIRNSNGEYYSGVSEGFKNFEQRYQKWGPFYNSNDDYGGEYCGEYEKFYKYTKSLMTTRPEVVTYDMIDKAEIEIYEEEAVYQIHYGTEEDGVVIGLSVNGDKVVTRMDENATFINKFLEIIIKDVKKYIGIEDEENEYEAIVTDCVAYLKPEDTDGTTTKVERNKLIEYSQMLNTIQGQRDYIQKGGNSIHIHLSQFLIIQNMFLYYSA